MLFWYRFALVFKTKITRYVLYKPFRWFFSVRSLRRFYPPYILLPKSYFVFQIQLWWIHDEKIKIFIIYITRVVCCWLCWGWLTEYTAQACTKHATLIIIIISVGLPPPPSIPHDKQLKNEWMNPRMHDDTDDGKTRLSVYCINVHTVFYCSTWMLVCSLALLGGPW